MRFSDLNVNNRGTFDMLLMSVKERDSRNGPYCVLTLKPSKEERAVEAKMWHCEKSVLVSATPEMSVVSAVISCQEYNGEKSYVVDRITPGTAKTTDYIESSDIDGKKMLAHTIKIANNKCFADTPELKIFNDLYSAHMAKLEYWPAAVSVHHNYLGGLITHMGTVAQDCLKFDAAASPEKTARIMSMNGAEMSEMIRSFMAEHINDPLAYAALEGFMKRPLGSALSMAGRKCLAMAIADHLTKNYRFINKKLLFTALLYRGISTMTPDSLAGIIGAAPADIMEFRKDTDHVRTKENNEMAKMVEHCLLVDMENSISPAIPEAMMASYCEKLADIAIKYSNNNDYSLCSLYISAALHDIGKLVEYSADAYGKAECTPEGHLYGHLMIGVEMIMESAARTSVDPTDILKLLNCVATHHGKKEWGWGTLTAPKYEEAEIVSLLDYLDSRMDIYSRLERHMDPESINDTARYSLGVIYKPNL